MCTEKQMPEKRHSIEDAILNAESSEVTNVESIVPSLQSDLQPTYDVKNEKPWHRSYAYMLLNGHTIKDCAEHFQLTPHHLAQVKKQEWFKRLTADLAAAHFEDDVAGLLKGAAIEAVTTMVELSQTAESESVRQAASNNLLEKYLKNKPPPAPDVPDDPVQEAAMLDAEIDMLEEQEGRTKPQDR